MFAFIILSFNFAKSGSCGCRIPGCGAWRQIVAQELAPGAAQAGRLPGQAAGVGGIPCRSNNSEGKQGLFPAAD